MRWYDYAYCILTAYFTTGLLFAGSILYLVPITSYIMYEAKRKDEIRNKKEK